MSPDEASSTPTATADSATGPATGAPDGATGGVTGGANGGATGRPAIEIRDLTIEAGERTLLREARLDVGEGEVVLLIGASGSGKSTLLRLLTGLDDGTGEVRSTGSVRVRGREVLGGGGRPRKGDPSEAADDHTPVGIVFQDCALFDDLTVRGNLDFALDHRRDKERRENLRERLLAFITKQGIDPDTDPRRLSGGQRQRVAIARTLAFDPDIIAFDEPTSGLDPASRAAVMDLILETRRSFGLTSLIVTHDYALADQADRVVVIEEGGLVEHDRSDDLGAILAGRVAPPASADDAAETTAEAAPETETESSAPAKPRHPPSAWMMASPFLVLWNLLEGIVAALAGTGAAFVALLAPLIALTPLDLVVRGHDAAVRPGRLVPPLSPWWWRYFGHYLRLLLVGSAIPYVLIAGGILGYVATHFTFTFLPNRPILEPLILEDVLPGLGFALYRIIVPVVATLLLAARNGAAITSDVGNRAYGKQMLAMRSLGASPRAYLLGPAFVANLVAFLVLDLICFYAAELLSLIVVGFSTPEVSPDYWASHFGRRIGEWGIVGVGDGLGYVVAKLLVCAAGVSSIAYACGARGMDDATEVSRATTRSIILATVFVLVVHFVFAFIEFDPPTPSGAPWLRR